MEIYYVTTQPDTRSVRSAYLDLLLASGRRSPLLGIFPDATKPSLLDGTTSIS